MFLLKNKIYLFCLGFIIIVSGCSHPAKKANKPESQINRQADSLLIICLNVLDTTIIKSKINGYPYNAHVFMRNYLEHELDSTIPLKPYCIISYNPRIGYDSTNLSAFFNKALFDKYNADITYSEIDTSVIHYFNYIPMDSVRSWKDHGKYHKLDGYFISKPILSDNSKYIYLEFSDLDSSRYCIFEKDNNGNWFLKKMELRYIV